MLESRERFPSTQRLRPKLIFEDRAVIDVLVKINNIISMEEIYLRQRSRAIWLKAGYRNTKFFHMTSLKHKAVNRITRLIVENNTLLNKDEIRDEVVRFFKKLLSSNKDIDQTHQLNLVNIIPKVIYPIQNKALTAIPSTGEIKNTVFSFQGDKALGPDGFPMFFFQDF